MSALTSFTIKTISFSVVAMLGYSQNCRHVIEFDVVYPNRIPMLIETKREKYDCMWKQCTPSNQIGLLLRYWYTETSITLLQLLTFVDKFNFCSFNCRKIRHSSYMQRGKFVHTTANGYPDLKSGKIWPCEITTFTMAVSAPEYQCSEKKGPCLNACPARNFCNLSAHNHFDLSWQRSSKETPEGVLQLQ